jgi:surfeit locus 1 family protein
MRAGFWQLDRKLEKEALFDSFETGEEANTLTSLVSPTLITELRFRPIELQGSFDPAHQVLLDNIARNGVVGYEILTPLRVGSNTVLVNRGWMAASPFRNELPEIDVAAAPRSLRGRLSPLPRLGLQLEGRTVPADSPWPRRLHYPSAAELSEQLGYTVLDYQVLLDSDEPDEYLRDWRPRISGPETNLGYAVQWFAFAIAVTVIFLVMNLKRSDKQNE